MGETWAEGHPQQFGGVVFSFRWVARWQLWRLPRRVLVLVAGRSVHG
jgi:hypothetical protein